MRNNNINTDLEIEVVMKKKNYISNKIEVKSYADEVFRIDHIDRFFYKIHDLGKPLPKEMETLRQQGYMYQLNLL